MTNQEATLQTPVVDGPGCVQQDAHMFWSVHGAGSLYQLLLVLFVRLYHHFYWINHDSVTKTVKNKQTNKQSQIKYIFPADI